MLGHPCSRPRSKRVSIVSLRWAFLAVPGPIWPHRPTTITAGRLPIRAGRAGFSITPVELVQSQYRAPLFMQVRACFRITDTRRVSLSCLFSQIRTPESTSPSRLTRPDPDPGHDDAPAWSGETHTAGAFAIVARTRENNALTLASSPYRSRIRGTPIPRARPAHPTGSVVGNRYK